MATQLATIQVEQALAEAIQTEAARRGLSIDDYLRNSLPLSREAQPRRPLTDAELEQLFDEMSEGTKHIAPLRAAQSELEEFAAAMASFADETEAPPEEEVTYSRADIYFDHD